MAASFFNWLYLALADVFGYAKFFTPVTSQNQAVLSSENCLPSV